jgi:hypothetical protein
MHDTYEAVLANVAKNKIYGFSSEIIARKVFDAVMAGEDDAAAVAATITAALQSTRPVISYKDNAIVAK